MLSKSTVLVLGAGASKPYDFPTGLELSSCIFDQLTGPGYAPYNNLREFFGFGDNEIGRFREAFYFSGKNSVDAFLEHRTEFLAIGKAATAAVLVGYENPWKVFRYDNQNWLRYLYNNLNTSFEEFRSNKLAIVTFNYDRVIEFFFYELLKNTYGKTDDECRSVLEKIPIIHLHGQLGSMPWQSELARPFGPERDPTSLRIAAEGIKIVHEDISDGRDKDFERAKGLMKTANQVLFMGFGYNKTNIDRLEVGELERSAMGTAVGLNSQERTEISKICKGKIIFCEGDCLQFMREQIHWD